jgi:ATP-dependent Clp protease ATP-binding subunit ClpA
MTCPACKQPLSETAVICVHCGFDLRSGRRLQTAVSPQRPIVEPLQAPLRLYEGFSGQARRAVHLAHDEARRFKHDYLGTEHLLLGALKEGSDAVMRLLGTFGTDPAKLYHDVEAEIAHGSAAPAWDQLPLTPAARRTFGYAREEAAALRHPCVGPEHLLLAVLREPDGEAVRLLEPAGVTLMGARAAARQLPEPQNRDWQLSVISFQ